MPTQDLIILAVSAVVVAIIVLVVWLAGFRETATIAGAETLAPLLADIDPLAQIADLAIDPKGRSAAARLVDGRVLLAVSVGMDVAVRLTAASAVRVRIKRRKATVSAAEVGFPALSIAYPEDAAPALLRNLSGK